MDVLKEGWFTEVCPIWEGVCLSLKIQEVLYHQKSEYQDIMVVQTDSYGKVLILDGIIQCTETDEFAYQEMMAFIPLCCHSDPKKVLIVGGGDGGVARELVKHPSVENIIQVEIDPQVVEVSKRFLPTMSSAFNHPKVTVVIGDGYNYIEHHKEEFDVIITDSSDPLGPALPLYQPQYYSLLRESLRPGGIICSQIGTVWRNIDRVAESMEHCRSYFPSVMLSYVSVPTYPTGQIALLIAGLNKDANFLEPVHKFTEDELDKLKLRYYSSDIHRSSFILPRFAIKLLYGDVKGAEKPKLNI